MKTRLRRGTKIPPSILVLKKVGGIKNIYFQRPLSGPDITQAVSDGVAEGSRN